MTKICAVAVGPDDGGKAAGAGAEFIEFRLDLFAAVPDDFSFFSQPVPTIATFRGCQEQEIYDAAFAAGAAYADIEGYSPFRDEYPGRTICSLHDFDGTPSADRILDDMADLADSGIPKAAYAASSLTDLVALGEAAAELRTRKDPFILIGMGKHGRITRVRADRLGSMLTYVSLGTSAGPGEFTLEETRNMTLHPVATGIVGGREAVERSRSPAIHRAAFASAHIPGIYLPFPVEDDEVAEIPCLVSLYGLDGLNVTMPHKRSVVPYLPKLSPEAERAGAVNTIDASLSGSNTDIAGVAALFADCPVAGRRVLVLGAGGAARAACTYLAGQHADIVITNRTMDRARQVADEFGGAAVDPADCTPGYDAVVLASPVSPVDPGKILDAGTFVADMTYPSSSFIAAAAGRGCRTVGGKTMLVAQAAASFERWTHASADTDAMSEAFEAGP